MDHAFPITDCPAPSFAAYAALGAKETFRQRFQCALTQCISHGFSVEESFGIIWEETMEVIELSYSEQHELYPELIQWAKNAWFPQVTC